MIDVFRTPDERFAGLPDWPFSPRYTTADGLQIHYVEEGEGDPILLLHGEPTWGFLYRKLIPRLAAVGRVIVPDLLGFGRSDKPVAREWYSYDAHFASLERFALELDVREATLVVHDWGGPLGLRLAVEHPERVARLVTSTPASGSGRRRTTGSSSASSSAARETTSRRAASSRRRA